MRVLVPVDADEERAIAAAETVTSLPKAAETVHVTVLNVEKEVEIVSDSIAKSEDWYDEAEFPSSVERAMEVLENAGVSVTKRREHADPAAAIIEVAKEIDADQIIMAGRKQTPAGKFLFGSVTQSVLLDSEIPVTIITR
jgi:nucleotide-binding universal stress UspA family protein